MRVLLEHSDAHIEHLAELRDGEAIENQSPEGYDRDAQRHAEYLLHQDREPDLSEGLADLFRLLEGGVIAVEDEYADDNLEHLDEDAE